MSVEGSLEDLSFPDILQVVHLSRQSGTLILAAPGGEHRVRFRNGLVCDASLGDGSPRLEDILVSRGLVPPAALGPARERQQETGGTLAGALVALGALSQDTLDRVVREEIRALVRSFVLMQEGEFRFEVDPDAPPPEEASLADGLGPEAILTGLSCATPPRWPPEPPEERRGMPRRVLLVSERSFLTLALREELERNGFEAVTCDNLQAGLDRARAFAGRSEPFFLVSDLVLPDRTRTGWGGGMELVRDVRSLVPGVVAIIVGEVRHPSAAAAARAAGATGYLTLPDLGETPFEDIGIRIRDFCVQLGSTLCLSDQLAGIDWSAGARTLRVADPLSLLRGLIGEMHAEGGGDIGLLVLRLASEYFERAALFAVDGGKAICRGAFGEPLDRGMRGATLPLDGSSVLGRVIAGRESCVGPIPEDPSNERFRSLLGGTPVRQSALLPIVSGRDVFGILYGDNAPSGTAFDDLKALEIFLSQAGLTLQNAMLRQHLEQITGGARPRDRSAAA